jgi:hypothetical protein
MVFQLTHTSTCTGTPVEMTMNYMDYTDDRGMYMFSNGPKIKNGCNFCFRWSKSRFRNIILNFIKGGDSINPFFILFFKVFLKITPI